jgi:hypothetical protein
MKNLIGLFLATSLWVAPAIAQNACCQPGGECCKPGASCCVSLADKPQTDKPPADCCKAESQTVNAPKEKEVKELSHDCCTPGAACCKPGAACCVAK